MRYVCIFILFFFVSCQFMNKDKPVLEFKKMQKVIWELMQSDDYYNRISLSDTNLRGKHKNIELYQQVFQLNNINSKDFYTTIEYYEKNPILFKELMDSVTSLSKMENLTTIRPLIK